MNPAAAAQYKRQVLTILEDQGIKAQATVVLADAGFEIRVSVAPGCSGRAKKTLPRELNGYKVVVTH